MINLVLTELLFVRLILTIEDLLYSKNQKPETQI